MTSPLPAPASNGHHIRSLERLAWLDFFHAAPTIVRQALGLLAYSDDDAAYLAATALPGVAFNRVFAVGPHWSDDVRNAKAGIEWLARNVASNHVVQIDEPNILSTASTLEQSGMTQLETGWMKLAMSRQPLAQTTALEVSQVRDEDDAYAFADVIIDAFGFPFQMREWLTCLTFRPKWHCYILRSDDYACAAAAAFVTDHGAWLGMDATLQDYRGQGMQLALIERRLHDAFAAGAPFAMAETARPQPCYTTAGRMQAFTTTSAAASPSAITRRISSGNRHDRPTGNTCINSRGHGPRHSLPTLVPAPQSAPTRPVCFSQPVDSVMPRRGAKGSEPSPAAPIEGSSIAPRPPEAEWSRLRPDRTRQGLHRQDHPRS